MAGCSTPNLAPFVVLNNCTPTSSDRAMRGGGEEQQDERFYHGQRLVVKVYEDMLKNTVAAWGANKIVIGKEMRAYREEQVSKDKIYAQKRAEICGPCYEEGSEEQEPMVVTKKKVTKMPKVEALPPMTHWTPTPINIPTPESKFLTNLPFLGDDHGKNDKEYAFGSELLELYDNKVHEADDDYLEELPETLDVIDFVRVLMEVRTRFSEAIFSDAFADVKSIPKPVEDDLRLVYDYVRKASEKIWLSKPSIKLCAVICSAVCPKIEPENFKKGYIRLAEKRNPEFNKVKTPPRNVDLGTDTKLRTKEAQMDSYDTLFCRICFKYACMQHTLLMDKEERVQMKGVVKLEREGKSIVQKSSTAKTQGKRGELRTVSPVDIQCNNKDCYKNSRPKATSSRSAFNESWRKDVLKKWTPTQRTLFNCYYESYEDYCLVASLLFTKTCREVKDYHQIYQLMPKDQTPVRESSESQTSPQSVSPINSASGFEGTSPNSANTTMIPDEPNHIEELCTFVPCTHDDGVCGDTCKCVVSKKFCERSCGCFKSCKNRSKGCNCLTTCDSKRCPCFIALRECDPDLCKNCGSHEIDLEKVTCKNIAVQRRLCKPTYIKKSTISGYGAFAGVAISKGEFVDEYTAELISKYEAEKRGHVYDERMHTYLFGLTEDHTLDASRFGNNCRFMNSSKRPNCQPFKTIVGGEMRLAIRAVRDIEKDEELFIDYHHIIKPMTTKKSRKRNKKYVHEEVPSAD